VAGVAGKVGRESMSDRDRIFQIKLHKERAIAGVELSTVHREITNN
jgi:hypothetical protein